MKLTYWLKVKN